MSSIYSADNPYYVNGPAIGAHYSYTKGTIMDYIYENCPLFALFLQKCDRDRLFDEPDLNCTCFVPRTEYSEAYLAHFGSVNYYFSEKVVYSSTIRGRIRRADLELEEEIPNLCEEYLKINCARGVVFVDKKEVLFSIECTNGIVHVIEGLLLDDFGSLY